MKVLVTGGLGYIGSHTVVELLQEGFEVVIADDLSNSRMQVLDRIEMITGKLPAFYPVNLCDYEKTTQLFENEKDLSAVIHFAASKAVGESVQKPLLYYKNNLVSLVHVLEMMEKFEVANIVFSSSCTVYGQPEVLPVTEQSPVKPAESPYGNTKQVCEEILRDACNASTKLHAIALRYFNPTGAHESALIGELPLGVPNNLVPFITQTAAGIREQLSIFGDDYNTPDGTAVRDYIHVVDLAKAHVISLQRMIEGRQKAALEFFNLGTGKGHTVLEVVKAFEHVNEVRLNYKIMGRRPGDIEKTWADTSYANKELGWRAELGLEDMVRSAWEWEKKNNAINDLQQVSDS